MKESLKLYQDLEGTLDDDRPLLELDDDDRPLLELDDDDRPRLEEVKS